MTDDPTRIKEPAGLGAPGLLVQKPEASLPGVEYLLLATRLRSNRSEDVVHGVSLSRDERDALIRALGGTP